MEKASRLEDRTVSRRGFLSRALVGGAVGLAGLVGLNNSTASAEAQNQEAQAKPNQERKTQTESYKIDPRDPFARLRQKYTYEDLKKALGKEYEQLPDDKKKRLENNWRYDVIGETGCVYEYYLKGICENPEEFLKALSKKERKKFAEFKPEKLEDYKTMKLRADYSTFLTNEDFKPKQGNLTRNELRNKLLIYVTESLSEKPTISLHLYKIRGN